MKFVSFYIAVYAANVILVSFNSIRYVAVFEHCDKHSGIVPIRNAHAAKS